MQFWRSYWILLPYRSICLQITPEVRKITKIVQCNITFIFIELSETSENFLKICLIFEIKNVTSFIKTHFYWMQGCTKMHKHAEMFHTNNGYKLAIVVFIATSLFSKWKFVVHFPTLFCTKMRSCRPLLSIWKLITSTLSFIWHERNSNVFRGSAFSQVLNPGPGPIFKRWKPANSFNLHKLRSLTEVLNQENSITKD